MGIAVVLVVLYFTQSGEGDLPTTPVDHPAAGAPRRPDLAAAAIPPEPSAASPTKPTAVEPASARPAMIKLALTKKTALWIDGKQVVHSKDTQIEIVSGSHEIRLRLGKKSTTQVVDLASSTEYELRFDPKSEKALLKRLR